MTRFIQRRNLIKFRLSEEVSSWNEMLVTQLGNFEIIISSTNHRKRVGPSPGSTFHSGQGGRLKRLQRGKLRGDLSSFSMASHIKPRPCVAFCCDVDAQVNTYNTCRNFSFCLLFPYPLYKIYIVSPCLISKC